jgi:hypothetical protein
MMTTSHWLLVGLPLLVALWLVGVFGWCAALLIRGLHWAYGPARTRRVQHATETVLRRRLIPIEQHDLRQEWYRYCERATLATLQRPDAIAYFVDDYTSRAPQFTHAHGG